MAYRLRHLLLLLLLILPTHRVTEWVLWVIFMMLSIYLLSFVIGPADFIRIWMFLGL